MAKQPRPDVKPEWVKPNERKLELLIISELTYWVCHYDPFRDRPIRCGGAACYHCHQGWMKQVRAVVMGIDGYGRERLLNVTNRMERAFESYNSAIGLRVWVRKAGPHKNSPIDLHVMREEHAYGRDITRLVESLGEPAVLLGSDEAMLPEKVDGSVNLEPATSNRSGST